MQIRIRFAQGLLFSFFVSVCAIAASTDTTEGISLGERIGGGSFGEVFAVDNIVTKDGSEMAAKIIKYNPYNPACPRAVLIEGLLLEILESSPHPCLMSGKGCVKGPYPDSVTLLMPRSASTLWDLITRDRKLDPIYVRYFISQILGGLLHLHEGLGMIHGDLKPDNIMIGKYLKGASHTDAQTRISDFGSAETIEAAAIKKRRRLTPWYMAPELRDNTESPLTTAADMYSLGLILCEFVSKTNPKHEHRRPLLAFTPSSDTSEEKLESNYLSRQKMIQQILVNGEEIPSALAHKRFTHKIEYIIAKADCVAGPGALALIKKLLDCDPSKRISARKALEEPFFTEATHKSDVTLWLEILEAKATQAGKNLIRTDLELVPKMDASYNATKALEKAWETSVEKLDKEFPPEDHEFRL